MNARIFQLARSTLLAVAVLVVGAATVVPRWSPARAEAPLELIGEFRPFPAHNRLGSDSVPALSLSVVDSDRRNWFFVTIRDPATGVNGPPNIWTFDLDGPSVRGNKLTLAGGSVPAHLIGALDPDSGTFFFVYAVGGAARIAAVKATPGGPSVVKEWNVGARLSSENNAFSLSPAGLRFVGGKGYLAVEAPQPWPKEVALLQFDVARFLAGSDPFDWRYRVTQCAALSHYQVATAIGKSRFEPIVSLPCRVNSGNSELQGVAVVELGSFVPTSTAGFTDRIYPIAGDYGTSESYYDPGSDRLAMRRTGPAQLVVFDARHRHWMRPVVFGQNNMDQSLLDETTGRIYGVGNDPTGGGDQEFVYVPELRPTPPQNGLRLPFPTPSPGSVAAAKGVLAFDARKRLVYVADLDGKPGSGQPDGFFFNVYKDNRAPFDEGRAFDPDNDVTNLSAESQGYGARVSYVGGVGSTYSNAFGGQQYPPSVAQVVAQGTRHITFARTLRARMTEGEASAEAIVSHPEGASDNELKNTSAQTGQAWPHQSTSCRDFGRSPRSDRDPSGGAEVTCDLDYPRTVSSAVYQASTQDPRNAPVQRAATTATLSIHATKGVVTTVTSEGSLDVPGIVSIGQMRATATTSAAGKKGTASSTYTREMKDVSIGGQPFCQSECDPDDVAAEINRRFSSLSSTGTLVVAAVPRPDPTLLASPGGVQAIVQRDSWEHEEEVGINDGADDRYEMPAFVIAIYQDRKFPQHELYSLAGVQAVSRLPHSLADKLEELASPDPDVPSAVFSPDLAGGSPASLADFDAPIGPAGSSLSAPLGTRTRAPGPGSLRFKERLAWSVASPLRSFPLLAVLAFLAAPVYFSSRRRVLLFHRPAHAGDADEG